MLCFRDISKRDRWYCSMTSCTVHITRAKSTVRTHQSGIKFFEIPEIQVIPNGAGEHPCIPADSLADNSNSTQSMTITDWYGASMLVVDPG